MGNRKNMNEAQTHRRINKRGNRKNMNACEISLRGNSSRISANHYIRIIVARFGYYVILNNLKVLSNAYLKGQRCLSYWKKLD